MANFLEEGNKLHSSQHQASNTFVLQKHRVRRLEERNDFWISYIRASISLFFCSKKHTYKKKTGLYLIHLENKWRGVVSLYAPKSCSLA